MPLAAPPFDDEVFDTLEECVTAVQAHAKSEGYAIVTQRQSNRRNNEYHRCDLACDRGKNTHTMRSAGIRPNAGSIKEECPFRAKVVKRALFGNLWVYHTMNLSHNHEPSHEPAAHTMHRRRDDDTLSTISRLSTAGAAPRAIHREVSATNASILRHDIYNDMASIRREKDGPYTATQRFLKELEDDCEFYKICRHNGRMVGAFWTFPWCTEMWEKYPGILCMDNTYSVSTIYLLIYPEG